MWPMATQSHSLNTQYLSAPNNYITSVIYLLLWVHEWLYLVMVWSLPPPENSASPVPSMIHSEAEFRDFPGNLVAKTQFNPWSRN